MDGFEVHGGNGYHLPNVSADMVDEGRENGAIAWVAAAGDVQDDPEQGRAGLEALIGVFFPKNGDERVVALEKSVDGSVSHTHTYTLDSLSMR